MKFFYRMQSDKGVTNSISFIVIILFVMTLLISFVDVGLYFNTKNQMMSAAENGSRSVALYGGVNTIVRYKRGNPTFGPEELAWASIPDNLKKPEMKTVIVRRDGIKCHPSNGGITAGDEVWCEITYIYNGIAGKFGLFNLGKGSDPEARSITIKGSSVSEVTTR